MANTTPNLPEVGDAIRVLGVRYVVTEVVPYSDWLWSVEAEDSDGETLVMRVPSGDRMTD